MSLLTRRRVWQLLASWTDSISVVLILSSGAYFERKMAVAISHGYARVDKLRYIFSSSMSL